MDANIVISYATQTLPKTIVSSYLICHGMAKACRQPAGKRGGGKAIPPNQALVYVIEVRRFMFGYTH